MEGSHRVAGMTPEKLAEVQRVHDVMLKAMDQEIWQMAEFVVTRQDDQLFGETEFTLREKALRMGAQALEATVNDRKEGVPRQQHRLCRLWPRRALPGLAVAEHHELDGADRRRGGLLSLPALPLGPQALGGGVATEADPLDSRGGGDHGHGRRVGQLRRRCRAGA